MRREFNPQATLALSNWGGIEIEINSTGEYVYYRWYGKLCLRPCKIYRTSKGRAYFRIVGVRYYIDDFLRVNY